MRIEASPIYIKERDFYGKFLLKEKIKKGKKLVLCLHSGHSAVDGVN